MDYQTELKRLEEGGNYWKPKAGKYQVVLLTEIEPAEPFEEQKSDGTIEKREQFKVTIQVDHETMQRTWTFGKGVTLASTYGQLVSIASKNNGTLKGLVVIVAVKTDGKKNDYTIVNL